MADVGQEAAALALVGLQTRGHGVEAVRQAAHLTRPAPLLNSHGVVTRFDPSDGIDQLVERLGETPDAPANAHENEHSDDQDDQACRPPQAKAARFRPPARHEAAEREQPQGDDRRR